MPTMHVLIKGKVQGVFYRATAKKVADTFGLKGWVRNTKEGNVELVITGEENAIDKMLAWCRTGPTDAKVTEVIADTINEEIFNTFSILR